MPVHTAPELRFGVTKEELIGLAGSALAGLEECARVVSRRLAP